MTKNQREKLVSQIATFIIVFSVMLVIAPYVTIFLALFGAIQLARRV
jgi:hypothetical protein